LSSDAISLFRRLLPVLALALLASGIDVWLMKSFELRNLGFVPIGLLCVFCYVELRAGRTFRGLSVFFWGIWLIACVIGFLVSGIRTPLIYIFPVTLMCTAWLQGQRAALLMTVGSILVLVALVLAERLGWLGPPATRTSVDLLVIFGSVCAVAGTVAISFADAVRRHSPKNKRSSII
jgi:hypothetical protein